MASRPIDKLTVVSTGGTSSLTRSVADKVAPSPQLGAALTGEDDRARRTALAGRTALVAPAP